MIVQTEQRDLDVLLRRLTDVTRILPALMAGNAVEERRRLVQVLERGEVPVPAWRIVRHRLDPAAFRWLDEARRLAASSPARDLYLARLEEVELDLCMMDALGDARRIRPLAARRFGTPEMRVPSADADVPLWRVAEAMLATVADTPERHVVPPASADPQDCTLASIMRAMGAAAGIEIEVRVEPRLVAGAAAGDRTVFVADRLFGAREAVRLAVHEVLGHLVASANGRAQPLRLFELGTAGSFADQEGLSIWLEEQAGVLDGYRARILAARVLSAHRMHGGSRFGETARELMRDHGFSAVDAVALAERAFRGGGVARDVGYLFGWLRVRRALSDEEVTVDELRSGKVGLADAVPMRALAAQGLVRPAVYRPSLARSLRATTSGTSFETSPPRAAASLTRFELT